MTENSHAAPGLEPLVSTSQLAAHLGLAVQAIHDLRSAGRGPRAIRVGRELRFRVSEVQAWLEGLEESPADIEGFGGGHAR